LREIDVEGADEMLAVDVEIGDGDGGVVGDFAFESETGLLDARGDEVRANAETSLVTPS